MPTSKPLFYEFTTRKKIYGVPSHNFVEKNVLWEKGDEITRFDGNTQKWKVNVTHCFLMCSEFLLGTWGIIRRRIGIWTNRDTYMVNCQWRNFCPQDLFRWCELVVWTNRKYISTRLLCFYFKTREYWFIEDQPFSPSYDLSPPPAPFPSPVSKLSLFLSLPVCRRSVYWREGRGVGEEPNHTTARKPGPP